MSANGPASYFPSIERKGGPRAARDEATTRLFTGRKEHRRAAYDRLVDVLEIAGGSVTQAPRSRCVGLGDCPQFALIFPSTPDRLDVGLRLPDRAPTARLEAAGSWSTQMTHRVRVTAFDQIDEELVSWLLEARAAAEG